MIAFMKRLFSKREQGTKDVAKNRLQTLLFRDRMDLPANFLDMMIYDVSQTLANYVEVESKHVDVKVVKHRYEGVAYSVLELSLPVRNIRPLQKENEGNNTVLSEEIISA